MSGFNQNLFNEIAGAFGSGNPYLRDYHHASKVFRTNNYQRAPKLKFLFHTYFEVNTDVAGANYGLLVKEVKLPTYTFNTVQLNQYNRKRIVQTKIKYDPIDITFHDDNASQATQLWELYYQYYYSDSKKPGSVLQGSKGSKQATGSGDYNSRNIYSGDNINGDTSWGFQGDKKPPFFKNITVFGMHQHEFTAYTLINPIITGFSHDTYNHSEGAGTMTNRMTIDYETVVYNYGSIDGRNPQNIITGFGDIANYDRELSPIAMPDSNKFVSGKGGLIDAAGGFVRSLEEGNPVGAIMAAGDIYNTFANPNLKVAIPATLNSLLVTAGQNAPTNRNTRFNTPVAAASPGPNGLPNGLPIDALTKPPNPVFTTPNAGDQYAGPPGVFTGFPPVPPFPRN
jgi:hypothetical protein